MKRVFYLLSMSLLVVVLAGCMSLFFGDSDNTENNAEAEADVEEQTEENVEPVDEENGEANEEEVAEETDNDQANTGTEEAVEECEAQDHSEFLSHVDAELFIPECAYMTEIRDTMRSYVRGNFLLENGNWEAVRDDYIDFLGDRLVEDEEEDTESGPEKEKLTAYIGEGDGIRTEITFMQEEENVEIIIDYYRTKND